MSKTCNKCHKTLPLDAFPKQALGKQGRRASCKVCVREIYQRSKKGVILTMYSGQIAKSQKRGHPPPAYTQAELLAWVDAKPLFHELYAAWVEANYAINIKPTCDRLDDYLPYSLDNLQLLTWYANTKKYHQDAINGINTKACRAVDCLDLTGNYIKTYHSISDAARAVGTSHGNIRNVCEGQPIKRIDPDGNTRLYTPKKSKGFIWRYSIKE